MHVRLKKLCAASLLGRAVQWVQERNVPSAEQTLVELKE